MNIHDQSRIQTFNRQIKTFVSVKIKEQQRKNDCEVCAVVIYLVYSCVLLH